MDYMGVSELQNVVRPTNKNFTTYKQDKKYSSKNAKFTVYLKTTYKI